MTGFLGDLPYTVHGFRSSFRDWAAEEMPDIPDPVAEAALSHVISDKVMAAYKRTEFLGMRRTLLAAWGAFVAPTAARSEEHTSELQSLMRTSYAVFCLKKNK